MQYMMVIDDRSTGTPLLRMQPPQRKNESADSIDRMSI